MSESDMRKLQDVPKGGPLQHYRNQASFNWKKMKLFFEDMEYIEYKVIY